MINKIILLFCFIDAPYKSVKYTSSKPLFLHLFLRGLSFAGRVMQQVVSSQENNQKKVKRCSGAFSHHNTFPERGSLVGGSPDGGSQAGGSQTGGFPDEGPQTRVPRWGSSDWRSSDQETLDRPRSELSLKRMTIKAYTTIILGRVWTKASLQSCYKTSFLCLKKMHA